MTHQGLQDGQEFKNQKEELPGRNQIQNNALGFSYAVDDKTRLLRFLIMGSENGTYYQQESELKRESIQSIDR